MIAAEDPAAAATNGHAGSHDRPGHPSDRDTGRRRPARTEVTRHKLFDAAMGLIGERGPANVTVDEIAAAAGVSKGSVYYNFGSKADLISELLEHGVTIMLDRLADGAKKPDALEALAAMTGQAIDFLADYPSFAQLWMAEQWRTPSLWHETLSRLRARLLQTVEFAIRRVAESREVDPAVPLDGVVTAVFGATFITGLDRAVYHPERSREEAVASIMAIMHGYLR